MLRLMQIKGNSQIQDGEMFNYIPEAIACTNKKDDKTVAVHASTSTSKLMLAFKEGDLLFGMKSDTRTRLNNYFKEQGHPHVVANDLNSPVVGLVIDDEPPPADMHPRQLEHYDFLKKHLDYLTRPDGTPVPLMKDKPREGAAYRRACKLLACSGDEKHRIHFDLTRMDMARVCRKEKADTGVSNSELRALYRQAVRSGENKFVFFYKNEIPCPPPWQQEEHKNDWKAYAAYRKNKKAEKEKKRSLEESQKHSHRHRRVKRR